MSIKFAIHKDVRGWVPSGENLRKLREYFESPAMQAAMGSDSLTVSYWPRVLASDILKRKVEPYAFRAVTRDGAESVVFCDETETPLSIAWLTAHELAHQVVAHTPTLKAAFEDTKPQDLDPATDRYHQVDPGERFADGVATRIFRQRLDRDWWRERVRLAKQGLGS